MELAAKKTSFGSPFILGTLTIMLVCWLVLSYFQRAAGLPRGTVLIDDRIPVRVEVAATPLAREHGLSGHAPLAADEGMLFIFDQEIKPGFWMKEMLFPLDFLWLRDGVIVDISTDVPAPAPGEAPATVFPREAVDQVLEVPAGFAARNGLKLGLTATYEP